MEENVFKSPSIPEMLKTGLAATQVDLPDETPDADTERHAKISVQAPSLNYDPPLWACEPDENDKFQFEILKEGQIIGQYEFCKRKHGSYLIIGRIKPGCDLVAEHPSISRYHCILQYGDDRMSKTGKGWHIYELGSTHGTKMNKKRLPPKQYIRVHVGFLFQFGESSRFYSLLGPSADTEPEWDCSPSEMRERRAKKVLEAKLRAEVAKEMAEEKEREKEEEGCGWGMDYGEDDHRALPNIEMDAHLMEDREAYYVQDPRKALSKFFEREGFDMNFEFSEQGQAHTHKWVCSIELPVEIDGVDRAFTASATVSTSKKDAQTQCALEACRILDAYNVLRKANTKLRMKRKTLQDNDYYDEDDDLYLDRTGQLEKQREKRKKWAEEGYGMRKPEKDTYESLCVKLEEARKEIVECQRNLKGLTERRRDEKEVVGGDVLDDYLKQLEKTGGGEDAKTKTEKSKWRQRLVAATHEVQKLEKLVKIAKPVDLPGLRALSATSGDKQSFLKKMMAAKKAKVALEEKEKVKAVESGNSSPNIKERVEEMCVDPKIEGKLPEKGEKVETEEEEEEEEGSKLKKRVAEWERELEAEREAEKRRKPNTRVRKRDFEKSEKKLGKIEDYGVGCEDREKYSTWMPPAEDLEAKQEALRAKFAGKY